MVAILAPRSGMCESQIIVDLRRWMSRGKNSKSEMIRPQVNGHWWRLTDVI